jgi:transcriptional regulator with XRE-family HTH domain
VGRRGRPTKTRTSELGLLIERLRGQFHWSVKDLAREANVSYKTLSKLELGRNLPRRPQGFLIRVARALEVHPDRLLIPACLTPILRPPVSTPVALPPTRTAMTVMVTEAEQRQLENYLQYLRYTHSVASLRRRAEAEIGFSANEEVT